MVEHVLHIFVAEAKVKKRHGSLCFDFNVFIVEHLEVGVKILNSHRVKVNCDLFGALALESLLMRLHRSDPCLII